jgi:hypothetical protein
MLVRTARFLDYLHRYLVHGRFTLLLVAFHLTLGIITQHDLTI